LPVVLDYPYSDRLFQPDQAAIEQSIGTFLANHHAYHELALTNSHPLPEADLSQLWQNIAQQSGYQQYEAIPLPDHRGVRYCLRQGNREKAVTLLAASTVLTFNNVSRPIRNGIDTIIGSTGYPIFSAKNLDDFLARPNKANQADELALISASSKDYEFRRAIDFLNILLKLQVSAPLPAEVRLGWFADFYRDGLSFLQGEDFAPLQNLLAAPITDEAIQAFVQAEPALTDAIGLTKNNQAEWRERLADFIAEKIRQNVTIRKEIRPDIGSIYHLVVKGQAKRVVLLADGLVVNFFARHEKGVKTEYIDPIVTMQVLSLVKLSTTPITPGLYKMDVHLRPEDMSIFWAAINDYCCPLTLN
jgi:hypothetical protein